ncbi:tetratricopeptide repeat protein [Aquimarina macrocephali]|uniref:tetratricopeptide repeat protein n=1 Tax=Aquimarina macrocephali TaxID=666563 RepID=UPI000463180F|nr:tetratricopeptide repeat protein [Aquimarina macrocephali]
MEVITTSWMMATLLSGWIGNRGDFWLCKGFNKLQKRITKNINEPANHHIQRAIRKSYLNAALLAVDHIQKQRSYYSLTDRRWNNLDDIKDYINDQISNTKKDSIYIRKSVLDNEHQNILFSKKGTTAEERMPELIKKLKDSIVKELESKRLLIELELKDCIYNGWKEGSKEFDFYKLTCAFFTQELKDNSQISTYVQTEYLDHIAEDVGNISLKVDNLKDVMHLHYGAYKNLLDEISEIVNTGDKIYDKLENLSKETAQLVLDSINDKIITPKEITISDEYRIRLEALEEIDNNVISLQRKIDGIQKAIIQVDEDTKNSLQQNMSDFEDELIIVREKRDLQENELNEFVINVISLAKQLNVSKNSDSERLEKARVLFKQAKYKELNDILNENDIDKDIKLYKERGKILAKELTVKAQATLLNKPKGWFKDVDRLYSKAIAIVESYDTTNNYAYFLHEHRQIHRAIKLYEKVIIYCPDDNKKVVALNNLGNLQKAKNEFDKAEKSLQEALRINRKLVKVNHGVYFANLACMTLNNLGNLQKAKNEFDKAEKSFQGALEIRRKLAQDNPERYLSDVASVLVNLGQLQKAKNEFDKAEKSFQEALEIRRKSAQDNPEKYLFDVASVLNSLGLLLLDKKEFNYAEKYFQETLEIYQKLVKRNSKAYLYLVAMVLNNFANLRKAKNEPDEAQKFYLKALGLYRKLVQDNPETYLSDVALVLNNLGILQRIKNEYEVAEEFFQDALDIYQKLAKENPQVYLIRYADICIELSILYQYNTVDKEKSILYAKKSLDGYSSYIPDIPHAIQWSKTAEEILAYWQKN